MSEETVEMSDKQPEKGASAEAGEDLGKLSIEKCFEELEGIVTALESQTTSLEDSLKLFERGMRLSQRCSRELTTIERKIQLILETTKGEVQFKEFEAEKGEAS